jgi:hypothetical protein
LQQPGVVVSPSRLAVPPLALVGVVVAVAACGSPSDPAPPAAQTQVGVAVWLLDAGDSVVIVRPNGGATTRVAPAPGLLVVQGQLWPGRAGGRLRRVVDPALRVNGTAVGGDRDENGALWYHAESPVERSSGAVTITLPQVEGVSAPAPVLRFGGIARDAADAPAVVAGELRLRVVPPAEAAPPGSYTSWTLEMARGAGQRTRVQSGGALPRDLVVPASAVPPGAGALAAKLTHAVAAWYPASSPGSDTTYRASVTLTSTLRWPAVQPGDAP